MEVEVRTIRRILVALDASAPSLAALETAAELAAALEAELEGFYVRDSDLLRVAGSSTLREIDALSAEPRQVGRESMERQLRFQARRAHQALQLVADARRLRWTFRTQSGRVAAEVTSAAAQADLLVLGFRSATPGRGPGSTVRAILGRSGTPLLLLGRRARLGRSIFVLWDDSEAGRRALGVAAALAAPRELSVTLLLPGSTSAGRAADTETALGALEAEGVRGRVIPLVGRGPDLRELAGIVRTAGCGLLVFPMHEERTDREAVADLVARLDCPLLLVRRGAGVRQDSVDEDGPS